MFQLVLICGTPIYSSTFKLEFPVPKYSKTRLTVVGDRPHCFPHHICVQTQ